MTKKSQSAFKAGHKHIKQEDAFTKIIERAYEYYVKAPVQAIITTIAVIAIIVFGSILISRWTGGGTKEPPKEAALALLIAEQIIDSDPQAATDTLRNLITRYPRTIPGKKARYYLGQALYQQGQFNEALKEFEEFEKIYPIKESFLKPAALYAQGNCLEEAQAYDQAAERYLLMKEKYPESSFLPFAELGAGRCMVFLKEYDRAKALYEEMLEEYSDNEDLQIRNMVKKELGKIDAIQNMF